MEHVYCPSPCFLLCGTPFSLYHPVSHLWLPGCRLQNAKHPLVSLVFLATKLSGFCFSLVTLVGLILASTGSVDKILFFRGNFSSWADDDSPVGSPGPVQVLISHRGAAGSSRMAPGRATGKTRHGLSFVIRLSSSITTTFAVSSSSHSQGRMGDESLNVDIRCGWKCSEGKSLDCLFVPLSQFLLGDVLNSVLSPVLLLAVLGG